MISAKAIGGSLSVRVDERVAPPPGALDAAKRALRAGVARIVPGVKIEVELIVVDQDAIKSLNRETRGKDTVTDVLSFPELDLSPGQSPEDVADPSDFCDGRLFLGSIVICAQRANEQAIEFGHSPVREFAFLSVHSLLHLLGWDHERSKEEEMDMFALQEKILVSTGLPR